MNSDIETILSANTAANHQDFIPTFSEIFTLLFTLLSTILLLFTYLRVHHNLHFSLSYIDLRRPSQLIILSPLLLQTVTLIMLFTDNRRQIRLAMEYIIIGVIMIEY